MSSGFNGQNFAISNLTVNRAAFPNHAGLFGTVGGSAQIINIGLINPNITGATVVGGIAGRLYSFSFVQNAYVSGGSITGTGGA